MGIFDQLTNLSPEQNQGLLAAASQILQQSGPSRMPTSFGQIFGGGLQAYQGGVSEAQKRKLEEEQARQMAQLRDLQLQAGTSDLQAQQQSRAQQAAIDAAAQGSVSNGQFDQNAFLQQVRAISPLKAVEYERQLAKAGPEFDTKPQTAIGPDGKPFQYIIAKNGQVQRLDGILPRDELKLANLGGRDVAYNPYALQEGQSFQRTQTPDSAASVAATLRGQNMTDARARELNAQGKIPPGYRQLADGSLQAIPGGPADPAMSKEANQRVTDARDVLSILDQAEPLIKQSTGSYAGAGIDQAARALGFSTPGAAAGSELQVLQGALISKMPKMSGPQSDKDVQLYREMAGRIGDTTLPADQRLAAARQVRALNNKYAAGQSQQAPKRSAIKGQVQDGYRFKGGDPSKQENWEKL